MNRVIKSLVASAAAAVVLGYSGGATAQSTWNLGSVTGACVPGLICDVVSGTPSTVQATLTGWGSTGVSAAYTGGTITDQGSLGAGFNSNGAETPPDHAFDNRAGGGVNGTATNEMLLISFSGKVALSAMATGWSNTDSDVSVLRWDGAGAPDLSTTNGSNGLAGKGWTLISSKDIDGNLAGTTGDTAGGSFGLSTGTGANKADTKVSSWWLISTFFGSTDAANGLENTANDFFKILSFTGTVCTGAVTGGSTGSTGNGNGNGGTCGGGGGGGGGGVPEPGSFALAALAVLGVAGTRRRWLKKA